jgi:hypothetical protein
MLHSLGGSFLEGAAIRGVAINAKAQELKA